MRIVRIMIFCDTLHVRFGTPSPVEAIPGFVKNFCGPLTCVADALCHSRTRFESNVHERESKFSKREALRFPIWRSIVKICLVKHLDVFEAGALARTRTIYQKSKAESARGHRQVRRCRSIRDEKKAANGLCDEI